MKTLIPVSSMIYSLLLLSALGLFSACGKNDNPQAEPPVDTTHYAKAQVWLTKGDKTVLFSKQNGLNILTSVAPKWPTITVDTSFRFQEIEGYGAALTGSSAYLFNRVLTPNARQSLIENLFTPDSGIGLSYLRLTIGASDFSLSDFTYDDVEPGQTDFNLQNFSLSQDTLDVVPILKEILKVAPNIRLLGSPWSPPAWMKTNGSLKGGRLKQECYPVYARYFVKYIQSMQTNGIRIDAITPQNEPLYATASYPCMLMEAAHQKELIRDHLGPAFQQYGLDVKIIVYDHNWDRPDYPIEILNDQETRKYVAGSAFHAYAGDVSTMSFVHQAHPDKAIYFTEISGGDWATNFSDNLLWNMKNILIGTANNWSKNALFWNLALDENHGPKNNGCSNCRGVVTITSQGQIYKNEEYYSLAHFSKFIRPEAVRILSRVAQQLMNIDAVAFQNIDSSKVLIVANYSDTYKTFTVIQNQKSFNYSIAPKSVATLIW